MFYIKIPVKPHVFRYIEDKYGHPYEIDGADFLGMSIITLLRRPIQKNERINQVRGYDHQLVTILRRKHVVDYGMLHGLDAQSVVVLNHKIDKVIDDLFIGVVDARVDLGERYVDSINYFISKYNYFDLSNDTFEMLKKRYYRYRKRLSEENAKKSPLQMSLEFKHDYEHNHTN